jgi:hypothetical protein
MAQTPQEKEKPAGRPHGWLVKALVAAAIVVTVILMMSGPRERVGSLGRPWASQSLKELVLAMHNYEGVHKRLPAAAILGKDGQPLLSWRVLILPYLEDRELQSLFNRFQLDEPWDSLHNMELLTAMPKIYTVGPGAVKPEKGHTYIQAFVGKGTAFEGTQGCRLPDDFPDGVSTTILLVEGGEPVPWTKPQDILFAANQPLAKLATVRKAGFYAAFGDGSVHYIGDKVPEATLRALITRNGGETIGAFD